MNKKEKKRRKKPVNDLYEEQTSTYRIFSRLFCNFIIPERPVPEKTIKKKGEAGEESEEEK